MSTDHDIWRASWPFDGRPRGGCPQEFRTWYVCSAWPRTKRRMYTCSASTASLCVCVFPNTCVPHSLMIRYVQVGFYVRHFDLVFAQTLSLSITAGFIKSIRRDHAHRKEIFGASHPSTVCPSSRTMLMNVVFSRHFC